MTACVFIDTDTADSSEVLRRLSRQLQRGHPAHKDIQLLLTVLDDPLLRTVLQIKVNSALAAAEAAYNRCTH